VLLKTVDSFFCITCCRLLGTNATADILQLSNSLSGPTRLHLVSGDELRVITRSDEPLENLLSVCGSWSFFSLCIIVICYSVPISFIISPPVGLGNIF